MRTHAEAVLWVDDDESVTRYGSDFLTAHGYDVTIARSLRAGLKLLGERRWALVVLDLWLPDGHGMEALRWLRAQSLPTPVLIVTGFGSIAAAMEAGRLGVAGFAPKPLSGRPLLSAIRAAIDGASTFAPARVPGESPLVAAAILPTPEAARILVSDALEVAEFFSWADAFRDAIRTQLPHMAASASVVAPGRRHEPLDTRVTEVLAHVESAGARWPALTVDVVAASAGIHPATLWRVLQRHLGRDFTECRRALVVRRALRSLADGTEHIRQVAYQAGYEHHSQFVRHCHRVLGVSPTGFRSILGTPVPPDAGR